MTGQSASSTLCSPGRTVVLMGIAVFLYWAALYFYMPTLPTYVESRVDNLAMVQVAMPLPWTPALLPEAPVLALIAALAGGLLGAHLGTGLEGRFEFPRLLPAAALAVVVVCIGIPLVTSDGDPIRSTVALEG